MAGEENCIWTGEEGNGNQFDSEELGSSLHYLDSLISRDIPLSMKKATFPPNRLSSS